MPNEPVRRVKARPEPQYSRSLEYGVSILERFTGERLVWRLSELADTIEMSRATAHRYATTLVALGYLEQDEQRRYRLAYRAVGPGRAMIGTLRQEMPGARTILEGLREQIGHTVSMATLDGTQAIYVQRLFAHGPGQYEADLNLGVGARIPTHCTAIGKALLASLSEPEQNYILEHLLLRRYGPNTILSIQAFAEELARARTEGIATCDEEQARGVRSIAAAVPHPGHPTPLAVSVTIPAQLHTIKAMITKYGSLVRAAAARI